MAGVFPHEVRFEMLILGQFSQLSTFTIKTV